MSSVAIEKHPVEALKQRYRSVRGFSQRIAARLSSEDCIVQSMPDVSPIRWHLAHTTWFFETFFLKPFDASYSDYSAEFCVLFNSYYNSVGEQFPRDKRGLLTRPSVDEIWNYREHIDRRICTFLKEHANLTEEQKLILVLGLHHEQQHQELMFTDIKHVFSCNPLFPAYCEEAIPASLDRRNHWHDFREGIYPIGHDSDEFGFDNEFPRHRVFLHDYSLASNLVTNSDYLDFIASGGYEHPDLWLSMGWSAIQENGWKAPLYWIHRDNEWQHFTLAGLQPIDGNAPVCHVSYFEAEAFARWAGARLPTEFEWEQAARSHPIEGNFAESQVLHPVVPDDSNPHFFGNVWEWTSSHYSPYPGFQAADGSLGEYNGKFMCNQFVLRGGSCATSKSHMRATYRNFFPPETRWQFSGIRLAN